MWVEDLLVEGVRMKLDLYSFLTNYLSIGADAIILQSETRTELAYHYKSNLVKDDLPYELYNKKVLSIDLDENYPDAIVVYLYDGGDF